MVDAEENPRSREGYNEADTLQLLSQTHLHSPGSSATNKARLASKAGESHIFQMFPPHLTTSSPNYHVNNSFLVIFFFL